VESEEMYMKVLIVAPEKRPYAKDIDSDLQSMQEVVGGLIQAVYPFEEPVALICNEEGKLLNLPLNRALRESGSNHIYDVVVGTFFLCGAPSNSENFESLTEEQIRRYSEVYAVPEVFCYSHGRLLVFQREEENHE